MLAVGLTVGIHTSEGSEAKGSLGNAVVYQINYSNILEKGVGNGYCTDLVRYYRDVPFRGDAKTWLAQAQKLGYTIKSEPKVGSIWVSASGKYGHVAYVLEVYPKSFLVIEQNVKGRWVVSRRIVQITGKQHFIY